MENDASSSILVLLSSPPKACICMQQYDELLDCHLWKVMKLCQVVQCSKRHDNLTTISGSLARVNRMHIGYPVDNADKGATLGVNRFNDEREEENSAFPLPG
jgi:hypothetical protein